MIGHGCEKELFTPGSGKRQEGIARFLVWFADVIFRSSDEILAFCSFFILV